NAAWSQLTDPRGFSAPYGITTAERRSPFFRTHGYGHCEWDGAVWPFATSQTLDGLANFLRDYHQDVLGKKDYYDAFLAYVHSQHADGKPYIGEYLDETTGQWINGKGGRSRYYNHSTFADLLITGIVGLVPRADDTVEVDPLLPDGVWNYFCLDGVTYHGHILTIIWDKDGSQYHRGAGLRVLADGKEIARGGTLGKIEGKLP
ncbi:MAG TPA: glycosyl hydrolase family 65 protein, partial [Verrucomicrobiae bacterium]|nr:glycosyl hydrolase family 65 protein [Verrucomicrobiae bacterium]